MSLNSSAVTPPMPSRMAVPSGSRCMPRISSVPPADHLLHQEAVGRTAGLAPRLRPPSPSGARRPVPASRLTATPPTSLLCVISRDRIFSTTRPPSSRAARLALPRRRRRCVSRAHGHAEAGEQLLGLRLVQRAGGQIVDAHTVRRRQPPCAGGCQRLACSMPASAAVQLSAAAKAGTPRCGEQRRRLPARAG